MTAADRTRADRGAAEVNRINAGGDVCGARCRGLRNRGSAIGVMLGGETT